MLGKRDFYRLWLALQPALVYIMIYLLLLSLGDLVYLDLAALPDPIGPFLLQHPGFYRLFLMLLSMEAASLPFLREGRLRIVCFRQKETEEKTLAERALEKRGLVWACLILAVLSACLYGNSLVQARGWPHASSSGMEAIYAELGPPVLFAVFGFFTPFVEELVFRGILYTGLRECLSVPAAVLLTSAVFGTYHGDPVQGVYAFCISIVFCLSMELLRKFEAPWMLHSLANTVPLALSYLHAWGMLSRPLWRFCFLICLLLSGGILYAALGPGKDRKPRF